MYEANLQFCYILFNIRNPIFQASSWYNLTLNLAHGGVQWSFVPPSKTEGPLKELNIPINLRVGDFNLDGYPDLVAVLHSKNKEGLVTVLCADFCLMKLIIC